MASAHLDLIESIYGPWERGDFSSLAWAHPEIEYVIVEGPTPGTWTGLAGLREGGLAFLSSWHGLRVKAEEARELDEDRMLVLTRLSGRGKSSGMELEEMQAQGADILDIRDGKVARFVLYFNRVHALDDLGLPS